MNKNLRHSTIKLIAQVLQPWVDNNVVAPCELKYIISNLKHLESKGEVIPAIEPKLIDMLTAASMLGISETSFKKLEKEGKFPFKRKLLGGSVRYRNIDIIQYAMSDESVEEVM